MTGRAEPPVPRPGRDGEPCHGCDAPLAADQRYCLRCGARRGAGGPIDFAAFLGARDAPLAPAVRGWSGPHGAPVPVAAALVLILFLSGIMLGSLGPSDASGGTSDPGIGIAFAPPPAPIVTTPPPPAPSTVEPAPPPQPSVSEEPAAAAESAEPAGGKSATEGDESGSERETATQTGDEEDAGEDAPTIEHVVVIMLAEQSQPSAFLAGSGAPFLSETLVPQGTLLRDVHTIAGSGLANAIALVSGQQPNAQTAAGCPAYADIVPATIGDDDQEQGEGCIYSVQTATIANQLERAGMTWRAYVEDQAAGGPGVAATCRHPAPGQTDPWREPRPGDAFITARNPFVYFRAIIDAPACEKSVVGLDALDADLAAKPAEAPALSYVVPNRCHDGSAVACAPGMPAGPGAADAFLAQIVPRIRAAPAYAKSLVVVTFDRAATPAVEGGKVGALLLSPLVRKGRTITGRRSTYSLHATIARLLALDPLANAARPDARPLGTGLFAAGRGGEALNDEGRP